MPKVSVQLKTHSMNSITISCTTIIILLCSYRFGSIDAISYTDVSCSNEDYQVLFQCDVSESEEGSCNTDQAVTVVCCELKNY